MAVEGNSTNKHSVEPIAVEADFTEGANQAHSYKEHIDKLISDALINGIAAWYVLELITNILHSFMFFFSWCTHIYTLLASAEIYKLGWQSIEKRNRA